MTPTKDTPQQSSKAVRWILLLAGLVAVALGILGIFLPVLPTVPFLLLAVACFARSSNWFYRWLLEHAQLGPMVRPYLDGQGLKRATKKKAIGLVWLSIAISIMLLQGTIWLQTLLIVIACGVTLYLSRLPTADSG